MKNQFTKRISDRIATLRQASKAAQRDIMQSLHLI